MHRLERSSGTPTDATGSPLPGSGTSEVPTFRAGGDFTMGVEEELMLVDPDGHLLGAAAAPVVESLRRTTQDGGLVTGEIYADQVELNSPACTKAEDVVRSLRDMRRTIVERGVRVMAVGVHPSAALGAVAFSSSPRYDLILAEYAGLLRTPTAALQVHVGVPDTDTAMRVYRGLRARMPVLHALAACSPFWHGRDSGLASARMALLRSYPRTTVPPRLSSWQDYVERTETLLGAAEAPNPTFVWWDLRPRPELGTLEVRVMDVQASLLRVTGLTALVQAIAREAAEAPPLEELSDHVLEVNDHRVTRHGLGANVVADDGTMQPVRQLAWRVLARSREVLAGDGLEGPLDAVEEMLRGPDECERQRRLVETHGMRTLLADLVARTANTSG